MGGGRESSPFTGEVANMHCVNTSIPHGLCRIRIASTLMPFPINKRLPSACRRIRPRGTLLSYHCPKSHSKVQPCGGVCSLVTLHTGGVPSCLGILSRTLPRLWKRSLFACELGRVLVSRNMCALVPPPRPPANAMRAIGGFFQERRTSMCPRDPQQIAARSLARFGEKGVLTSKNNIKNSNT